MRTPASELGFCLGLMLALPATARAGSTVDVGLTDVPAVALAVPAEFAEPVFLSVSINGRAERESRLFLRRGAQYLARTSDLDAWQIAWRSGDAVLLEGARYVALDAISGLGLRFDEADQTIDLTIDAAAFRPTRRSVGQGQILPTEGAFAAFLNYDVVVAFDHGTQATGYVEAGLSDDWGLVTSTANVAHVDGRTRATRLDSYFLRDSPDRLTRLVIGDTLTAPSDWSDQLRFAGLRLGTQFSLQAGFIPFPTPVILGSTGVPSDVDLLVNNALAYRGSLDRGPFSFDNLPVVSGSGEVELQVRDMLGVERSVKTAYYVSRSLLRPGLAEWSVEAGAERRAYGFRSFAYGDAFVAGSYRHGLTGWLTAGARAHVARDGQALGSEVALVVAPFGELGAAGAMSSSAEGTGWRYRVQARRIAPAWSLAASFERSSADFFTPGLEAYRVRFTRQAQVTAGVNLGALGSLGLAYTDRLYADGEEARIASTNYNVALGRFGYASLFGFSSDDGRRTDVTVGFGLTIPLGDRSSGHVQGDKRSLRGELRQRTPNDRGLGYRLAVERGRGDRALGELRWRDESGDYGLQLAHAGDDIARRVLASGGVILAGGELRLRRRPGEAIALVSVPGQANVRVYSENRLVARTDADGDAIIPGLVPYARNNLSIAPDDVPMDVALERTALVVVPRQNGAARAVFAAQRERPATVIFELPDGSPLPPGTLVHHAGGDPLFSGYDSDVFVPDLERARRLWVDTVQGPCSVVLQDEGDEIMPRLGPFRCTLRREMVDAR